MAKYDGLRKVERNKTLSEFAKAHPELSFKEVGRAFGISAHSAWRIVREKING